MDAFRLIKQLDNLQQYSKLNVVEEYESGDDEYEEILLSKSVYPNGQSLGFYNYSRHDLSSLSKLSSQDIKNEFLDYIDSYSDNIYDIFEIIGLDDTVQEMSDEILLNKIISLSFKSSENFLTSVYANIILKSMSNDISIKSNADELDIALKLKELDSKRNISLSSDVLPELSILFGFKTSNENFNYIIHDMAFNEDIDEFKNIISQNNNLIVSVSSQFFDENQNLLENIKNPNTLEAIISLPIHQDDSNLMIISLNSHKTDNNFLFIDESESLIHTNKNYDYSYVENEIIPNIVNFSEYENGFVLPISSIISKSKFKSLENYLVKDDGVAKHRVFKTEVDEILDLQEKQASIQEKMIRHHKLNFVSDNSQNQVIHSHSSLEELTYSRKRQPLENLLYKNDKKLLQEDVIFVNLSEIADIRSINFKNDKDSILVAACKQCTSKLVNYNHDVDNINPDEIYLEIDNISSDVLKQYLYTYLSSFNGLDEIKYFSKKNHMITPDQLGFVKIPILKVTTQLELVDAVRESEEFFKSIELLRKDFQSNVLDYKHVIESITDLKGDIEFSSHGDVKVKKSMRHAYNDLIWPLASSYLQATKGSFEIVEKKDNYLVLFEFIAAFNFIILLSGLPDNVYQNCKRDIWDSRNLNIYKDMTFGKWVRLSQNIAKVYRKNNFTSKLDGNLFNKISSNKILKILDKTKDYRNDESHSAQSNKHEAEKTLNELNIYLKDIFEILEVYSNYKLIYVLESNNLSHRVISLNGACAPPIYDTIKFDEKLENERLYLYNPKNNKKLLIKDNFMKFAPLDDVKRHWALFLYDSCDYNEYNAFYKCYQSNEEDLKVSIYDFKDDIID